MRRKSLLPFLSTTLCAVAFMSLASNVRAQGVVPAPSADANQIVAKFIANETAFQRAFARYAFRRDAVIQSIGMGGQVTGEFHRLSRIFFDAEGKQQEKVLHMPIPTLAPSQTDMDDLNSIQLFVLEGPKLAQYDFKLVGREKIDEINAYVFDVGPKVMPNPKKSKDRFFEGRVWIDDQDFQIVKANGKGVPQGKEVFPIFDYYREHDGRYWVPSLVTANDELVLQSGDVVRVRMRVRYTNYESPNAVEKAKN
ncbi:MAG: hypothetical protein QOE33_532 [Acidobacteriota bacterium]|nr:hypothetical protein [Acidobacteriota bacterium]